MYTFTDEQMSAIDLFSGGKNLAIHAAAGTGKTTTLRGIADAAHGKRGLYLAFNRSVADDASRRFAGTGVVARTVHSIAYQTHANRERLNMKPLFWAQKAKRLNVTERFPIGNTEIQRRTLIRLAEDALTVFCRSQDDVVTTEHVTLPPLSSGTGWELEDLRVHVARIANDWWSDWLSSDGVLPHKHDTYLKMWAMSTPELPYDYILVDEAQDLDHLTIDVLEAQASQLVAVGDPHQAIYGWRGAVNALDAFGGERTNLSQSFRFGEDIADEANRWLTALGSDMLVRGTPGKPSSVWASKREPEAVLVRTNGGAIREVLEAQRRGLRVGVAGERKAHELTALAKAAVELQDKGKTGHRELDTFTSWDEVREYAKHEEGGNLSTFVSVIDKYGAEKVVHALGQTSAGDVQQFVSTAHIAKGLEWFHVRIADDFRKPGKDAPRPAPYPTEEARLAYVSVTRAMRHLDPGGLAFVREGVYAA